jgi:hypothetical protein
MNDPLHAAIARKRREKRGQADPEPEAEPGVRTPLIRRQGPSSMPPRERGSRKTIDDWLRAFIADARDRPRGWRRI